MGREDDRLLKTLNDMLQEWKKTNEALEDIHEDLQRGNKALMVIHQDLQAIDGELQQPLPSVTGKIFLGKPVPQ